MDFLTSVSLTITYGFLIQMLPLCNLQGQEFVWTFPVLTWKAVRFVFAQSQLGSALGCYLLDVFDVFGGPFSPNWSLLIFTVASVRMLLRFYLERVAHIVDSLIVSKKTSSFCLYLRFINAYPLVN